MSLVKFMEIESVWGCRINSFVNHSIIFCSCYSYAWISLDRFAAVWMHRLYKRHCTALNGKKFLTLITLLLCAAILPKLTFAEFSDEISRGPPSEVCSFSAQWMRFDRYFLNVFAGFGPVLPVIVCNLAIAARFLLCSRKRTQKQRYTRETRLSISMVSISLSFLLSTMMLTLMWHLFVKDITVEQRQKVTGLFKTIYASNCILNTIPLLLSPSVQRSLKGRFDVIIDICNELTLVLWNKTQYSRQDCQHQI